MVTWDTNDRFVELAMFARHFIESFLALFFNSRSQASDVLEENAIALTCQCDCAAHRLRQRGANLNDSPTHQSATVISESALRYYSGN